MGRWRLKSPASFRRRSKKTPKLRVNGLCEGNSPVTGEFPSQMASNAEMFQFDDVIMICRMRRFLVLLYAWTSTECDDSVGDEISIENKHTIYLSQIFILAKHWNMKIKIHHISRTTFTYIKHYIY